MKRGRGIEFVFVVLFFRRPFAKFTQETREEAAAAATKSKKKDEEEDNWEMPDGDIPS